MPIKSVYLRLLGENIISHRKKYGMEIIRFHRKEGDFKGRYYLVLSGKYAGLCMTLEHVRYELKKRKCTKDCIHFPDAEAVSDEDKEKILKGF